ncbi:hypothetical protein ES703_106627 [subsurface metagenome]
MGILALILGILGGLCGVMGIITAAGVVPTLGAEFTVMFWLVLAGILLVACVASLLSRSSYE